jgi:HD-GYP domain-containing protein (c-di-GMP phosphodiesterase class II)
MEQALRTCLIGMGLGRRMGLTDGELRDVYYVSLLRFLGCTSDAFETAAVVGGDELVFRAAVAPALGGTPAELIRGVLPAITKDRSWPARVGVATTFLRHGREIPAGVSAHCEVAENLASRLGLDESVRLGVSHALERWDGKGLPRNLAGEEISLAARIAFVARDAEILARAYGIKAMMVTIRRRSGAAYDPSVAQAFLANSSGVLDEASGPSAWDAVQAAEPEPRLVVEAAELRAKLEVFADFADLKSPFMAGHSRATAELASLAAPASDRDNVRCAGLVHDLGRVAIPNGVWGKPGPLSDGDWEQVRLHAYYTERVLSRCSALAELVPPAGMHHERADGSGYHRGSRAADTPPAARLLAAADAYQAMTEPRPHRAARSLDEAARELQHEASAGRLDRPAVEAVLAAAGHTASRSRTEWPAGLSDREVEVLRLIARGSSKKEVAQQLVISPSTADHHVRHIYDKIGVSTRAGAALFALQHQLL